MLAMSDLLGMPQKSLGAMGMLVGRSIKHIEVSDGEDLLAFDTDAGRIVFVALGDGFSESWFADIAGVSALLRGDVVTKIEEVPMPDPEDSRGRQGSDKAYGYRLTTAWGVCDIIFRNSSNGFYGGWLVQTDTPRPDAEFRAITEDWSA